MSASKWTPIQHIHLSEQVYEAVRDRILSRAITIEQQVNVDEIAEELGVSRTPVLDAIKRLSSQGLVEIKARRGTFVRGITENDIKEIFQLREALEIFALRYVLEQGLGPCVIERMTVSLQQMASLIHENTFTDYTAFTHADRHFHSALIEACNNQRMREAYQNLNVHLQIMRGHFFKGLEPPLRVHADHTELVEAISQNNLPAAERVLRQHLNTILARMLENVKDAGGVL